MARQLRRPGDIRLETQRASTARGMRNPSFTFRGDLLAPQLLQWGVMFPVLAGETLKSLSVMGRIVGAPTTSQLAAVTGSWFEHWLFYVRIGDLPTYAEQMRDHISTGTPAAPTWTQLTNDVRKAVWDSYFKDDDEPTYLSQTPVAALRWAGEDWLDSAYLQSTFPPADTISGDWEDQWVRYQQMRRTKLTTNTFEEYLAKVGVAVPPQLRMEDDPEHKVPELLHYSREFVYPQPTTNPSGTTLAHAVQWFLQDKITRGRFFAEPGVMVHAFAVRPKVLVGPATTASVDNAPMTYLSPQVLNMPPEYDTDPHTSIQPVLGKVHSPTGDTVAGADVFVDARDALLYGYDAWSGAAATVMVRTLNRRPTQAQIDTLAKYACDFYLRTSIASRISRDTTA